MPLQKGYCIQDVRSILDVGVTSLLPTAYLNCAKFVYRSGSTSVFCFCMASSIAFSYISIAALVFPYEKLNSENETYSRKEDNQQKMHKHTGVYHAFLHVRHSINMSVEIWSEITASFNKKSTSTWCITNLLFEHRIVHAESRDSLFGWHKEQKENGIRTVSRELHILK